MKKSTQEKQNTSRRSFLKHTATTAAGFIIVPRYVLGGPGYVAPSDKVNVAIVGAGGRGRRNVEALLQLDDVQVTAIADPAEYWDLKDFYYQSKAGRGPVKLLVEDHYAGKTSNKEVATYADFRVMLEQEPALDAVLCATPDHNHAYVSLLSMRAGKHVYCEKPLTHNIWEAREVRRVANETGLATQMGNQLHSTDGMRQTVEYLRAGAIGPVRQVHAWVPATRWIAGLRGLPEGNTPVPKGLDWNLWLGPRQERPFHEAYAPVTWRDFWDFGCGALGDFGCHDMDSTVWAFDLPAPETVEMRPAGYSDAEVTPYGEIGYYHFPARGDAPPLDLTWYSGGLRPPQPEGLPADFEMPRRGVLFEGEKGYIICGGNQVPHLFPESLRASFTPPEPSIPRSNGHHRDWIDAIKGGPAASSNFDYAARLTEITLLGVLSLRLGGEKIYWDAEHMKATGMPAADEIIREPVRAGWEMTGRP